MQSNLFAKVRESRLILASGFFALGAAIATLALASLVKDNTLQLLVNLVVTPVATLAAAYAGARIAYEFQLVKENKAEAAQNVRAANTVIFQLIRTANHFHIIEQQYIADHRGNEARHFIIDAGMECGLGELDISFESLAFLFVSPQCDLLRTLAAVQLDVNATVDVIRQRRHWHVDKFQPAMDSVPVGAVMSAVEVAELVGQRISITLRKQTDDVVEGIDHCISGLRSHAAALRNAVKAMYPAYAVLSLTEPKAEGAR